ncbi:dihydrofolate reductase [Lachnospiraceae bacterium MD308]|nr:dihydrofolate reductase [Lachnospiraceae bacterium MD308]
MRRVVLFIAMSLDGYIADSEGGVDWLKGQDENAENVDVYSDFVKDVDTVVMGWNTYHQIVTELSLSEWIYADLSSYVITHRDVVSAEKIVFSREDLCNLVKRLAKEKGKDIWICGGAEIIRQLMREDMIDIYYISVIPVILGKGIRLFGGLDREIHLRLRETQSYNGITDLVYERRSSFF